MRRKLRKDFSGRFLVRIPMHLPRTLAEQALSDRISLNQYILYHLSRGASIYEFERFLKSVKNTIIEDMESVIESDRITDTPKLKLRLMDLVMKEISIEKPAGKLHLEGQLSLKVDEDQQVVEIKGKNVVVASIYVATIKSVDTGEELRLKAVLHATYLGIRALSRAIQRRIESIRLSAYPGRVFRDLLTRLITNLDLAVKIPPA